MRDRFLGAMLALLVAAAFHGSSVGAAEEVMRQLQAGAAREGQIVHPDVTQKVNNMRAALDMARQDLDSGSLSAARENILAAETYAARVIKSGGGR